MTRTKTDYLFSRMLLASVVATLLLCAFTAAAQSGRRTAKPASPEATPTPDIQPDPPKRPPPDKTGPTVLVGMDNTDTFSNIPLYFSETVLRSCVDRLDDSSVKVSAAGRAMNRGEAVKKAKELKDEEGYVALLQLKFDNMSNSNSSIYDLVVEYVVFAPTTAKTVASGRAYLGSTQKGAVIPRTGGATNAIYTEQLLKRAGEEAAQGILRGLHIGILPRNGP